MRFLPFFFALSLFGSALLSFSVQPILGKMLLPVVGGAPAGWIVAMAFFQLSLLAGYGVSYLLGRTNPFVHAIGLLVLYVGGLFYLPPHLPSISSDMHGMDLSLAVIKGLSQTIFVPFLALTATTSAMQRVFAATQHKTASDPYYLFVASNIGSFVGLLAYPFLLEPLIGIAKQTALWQMIYFVVMGLLLLSSVFAWVKRKPVKAAEKTRKTRSKLSMREMFMWLVLAFVPCSLSMGITTYITADLGSMPLLWVLPLGLYLLTFVLAFSNKKILPTSELRFWHQVVVVLYFILAMVSSRGFVWNQSLLTFTAGISAFLTAFFIVAWSCHQQLAERRPPTDRLPQFYFILALGGALAGIVHAFVLPYLLPDVYEFGIVLMASLVLNFGKLDYETSFKKNKYLKHTALLVGTAIVFLIAGAMVNRMDADYKQTLSGACVMVYTILYLLFSLRPQQTFILTVASFLVISFLMNGQGSIYHHRNFFGVYRVADTDTKYGKMRSFTHGSTLHGMAVMDKNGKLVRDDFGYYLRGGPIDDVLKLNRAKTLAVLGLGTGQLGCFSKTAKTDFYEIDPDIVTLSNDYFPYLKACKPRHIYIGDGRIELQKAKAKYDVILQDAFTSDGIPMHILTQEAFEGYKTKLNAQGILLFHISNRYLDLALPIAATAARLHWKAYQRFHKPDKDNKFGLPSNWVAIPMNAAQGNALKKMGWREVPSTGKPWTDDRSSLFEALMLRF